MTPRPPSPTTARTTTTCPSDLDPPARPHLDPRPDDAPTHGLRVGGRDPLARRPAPCDDAPLHSPLRVDHDRAALARRRSFQGGSPERRKVDQQERAAEERWSGSRRKSRSRCAQRPKASERREPRTPTTIAYAPLLCSTPEGIGAARTFAWSYGGNVVDRCSTPEGIGAARTTLLSQPPEGFRWCAQRPKASERREPQTVGASRARPFWCSTPEGIGAARTTTTTSRSSTPPRTHPATSS